MAPSQHNDASVYLDVRHELDHLAPDSKTNGDDLAVVVVIALYNQRIFVAHATHLRPHRVCGRRQGASPERSLSTRSAYRCQSRPSTAIISPHSRFDSPLSGCVTVSPASIRRSTASMVAENVAAPSR